MQFEVFGRTALDVYSRGVFFDVIIDGQGLDRGLVIDSRDIGAFGAFCLVPSFFLLRVYHHGHDVVLFLSFCQI